MMAWRVICLGNELVGDDGIGVRVGRVLRELPLPDGVRVEVWPHAGLDILEQVGGGEDWIVVDATVTGAPPGTCRTMDLEEIETLAHRPVCCHGLGVAEIVTAAGRLAPDRVPRSVRLVGIEAQSLNRFGTSLSPAVRDALPEAVDAVLASIGAGEPLRERGRAEAECWKQWEPDAVDTGE